MANILVRARPRLERLSELHERIEKREFAPLQPFGAEMQRSLESARLDERGFAAWETMCFCPKPLLAEREHALDLYFDEWQFETMPSRGVGWAQLKELPSLWDQLDAFKIPVDHDGPGLRRSRVGGLRH